MPTKQLKFTELQLYPQRYDKENISNVIAKISRYIENMPKDNHEANKYGDNIHFQAKYELIQDNNYLWIYIRYGNVKPYSEDVANIETKKITKNPKKRDDVELKEQLFAIYMIKNYKLYLSNNKLLDIILQSLENITEVKFDASKYCIDPKEFTDVIEEINKIQFTSFDKDLLNISLFNEVRDKYFLDDVEKITIDVYLGRKKIKDRSKLFNFITGKKQDNQTKRLMCVGKTDTGMEKIFNLDSMTSAIKFSSNIDGDGMYDPDRVQEELLNRINTIFESTSNE